MPFDLPTLLVTLAAATLPTTRLEPTRPAKQGQHHPDRSTPKPPPGDSPPSSVLRPPSSPPTTDQCEVSSRDRPLTTVEAIRLGSHILTLRHARAGWFARLGDYTFGPYETRRIALTELAVHLHDKGNPQAADRHLRPNNRLDRLLPRRIPTRMKA